MTGLLYIFQPEIIDLPPGTPPGSIAWFAQFSSGHLRHADQQLVAWAGTNGIYAQKKEIGWAEYQRLLAESHWYE